MKIIVNKTFNETVSSGSHRCSDGHYRESNYTQSVNVYSDSGKISITVAEKICNFIKSKTNSDTDKVWDWSYEGGSTEEYNSLLTKELFSLLENENIKLSKDPNKCPILLNPIALKLSDSHKLIISELKVKQSEIQKKFQNETLKCKAEIAQKAFYSNDGMYHLNELMHDFNEFPLDIARLSDDIDFLEFLLSRGATKVKDSYIFAEWLCQAGKFEYLERFADLSKLQLIRVGSSIDNNQLKNYRLTECILYYAIVNNRLDIFKEYGKDRFGKDISEVNFSENSQNYYSSNYISVGLLSVKHSNLATVKELYGKCSFYDSIKSRYGTIKYILGEFCFRDIETASFFMEKMPVDSIYSLFYWGKIDLLNELINLHKFDFSKIYLSCFSEFFQLDNYYILEYLSSINSFSLIKLLDGIHIECGPTCFLSRSGISSSIVVITGSSVLETCVITKNFTLLDKIFNICKEKEEIESFDVCRLLFTICKYDLNNETEDIKTSLLSYINPLDLRMLLGVSCIENNIKLIEFLISKINNINEPFEIEPTLFGLESYKNQVQNITKDYLTGTLIHLSLVSNLDFGGRNVNIETIRLLLFSGIDKTTKDKSGRVAFDIVRKMKESSDRNELLKLLFFEGVRICEKNGDIYYSLKDLDLPILKRITNYKSEGLNAVEAYKTQNKDALDDYLKCGADIDTIKERIEEERIRKEEEKKISKNDNDSNDSGYDDAYSEKELRDMYRDAFDGFEDAEWNID